MKKLCTFEWNYINQSIKLLIYSFVCLPMSYRGVRINDGSILNKKITNL